MKRLNYLLFFISVLKLNCMTMRVESGELFSLQPGQVLVRSERIYYVCSRISLINQIKECRTSVLSQEAIELICRNNVIFTYNDSTHRLEVFKPENSVRTLFRRLFECEWTTTPLQKTHSIYMFTKDKNS